MSKQAKARCAAHEHHNTIVEVHGRRFCSFCTVWLDHTIQAMLDEAEPVIFDAARGMRVVS